MNQPFEPIASEPTLSPEEAEFEHRVQMLDLALKNSATNQDTVVWVNPGPSQYGYDLLDYVVAKATEAQKESSVMGIHAPRCFQSGYTSTEFAHNRRCGPLLLQVHLPKGSPALPCGADSELVLDRSAVYTMKHLFKHSGKIYADCDMSFPGQKGDPTSAGGPSSERDNALATLYVASSKEYTKEALPYGSADCGEASMARYWHLGRWITPEEMRIIYGHEELEPSLPNEAGSG